MIAIALVNCVRGGLKVADALVWCSLIVIVSLLPHHSLTFLPFLVCVLLQQCSGVLAPSMWKIFTLTCDHTTLSRLCVNTHISKDTTTIF